MARTRENSARKTLNEMKGKQSLAQTLRDTTALAKRRFAEEGSAAEKKAREDDIELQKKEHIAAQCLFEKAKREMTIMSTDKEEYPRWAYLRAEFTRKLLKAEELLVQIKQSRLEPENSTVPIIHS